MELKQKSLFIKMIRDDNSLERLLSTVRLKGCEVLEMSACRSLDSSCYFVRMSIQGNGSSEGIEHELSGVNGIRQVEVNASALV